MTHTQFCKLTCRLILAAATASIAPGPGIAHDTAPAAPRVDCSKAANKNKPACKSHHGPLSNDEIYNAAYWLAHEGQYKNALTLLDQAKGTNDPRILNETGFVTRKLGNVDGALPYYRKALSIDPNYTLAREYMGEAFVTKGDLASAREQLREIEKRCGTRCLEYAKLAEAISASQSEHTSGGG